MPYNFTARKAAGYATLSEPGKQTVERDTLQCCHCGSHWEVVPGSGIKRGYCMKCMSVTCGRPECERCLPMEKWLAMVEKNDIRQRSELGIEVK